MQGKRRDFTEGLPEPGDFGKGPDGRWYGCVPGFEEDVVIANLSAHDVVEHDDGTITVAPSILVSQPHKGTLWHGYLERGMWREV